jgi:hypothetical protein
MINYITSLDQLQQYSSVANTFDYSKLIPFEQTSITKYMEQWFTTDLIEQVFGLGSEEEDTTEWKSYNSLMFAHVAFSMLEYSKEGEIIIGDLGFTRTENENTKSAYAQQMKQYRDSQEDSGYMYVGKLIEILDANLEIFPLWEESPGYLNRSKILVRSAKEFNAIQRLYRMHTTFIELIPNIIEVQDLSLSPYIGEDLFQEIIENQDLEAEKVIARGFLITALVNLTMALSLKKGLVKLTPTGVIVIGHTYNTSNQTESSGMPEHTSTTYGTYLSTGQRYLEKTRDYLITEGIIIEDSTTPSTYWAR